MMEVMVTTGARRAKLQSDRHHRQTNTRLFAGGCPSCRPTNSVKALMEKKYHIPWICFRKITCSLTTKGSWLPWVEGRQVLSSAL